MKKQHILIVEDDENIQQLVGFNLNKAGFQVSYADYAEEAFARIGEEKPDLVILDLMLPSTSGLEICRILRQEENTAHLPIIMLTAKGEEEDIATGLDVGADDYITKPFSPKVLVSRVKAVMRRKEEIPPEAAGSGQEMIRHHELAIDPKRYEVVINGSPLTLTVSEFGIIQLLARHPGWVFSRQQIIDSIRGYDYFVTPRAVDVQIFGLRKKLGEYGKYIETVHGIGYRMKE